MRYATFDEWGLAAVREGEATTFWWWCEELGVYLAVPLYGWLDESGRDVAGLVYS